MLKILANLKQKERRMVAISLIFIVTQVWMDLKMPEYMSTITTLVQTPGSSMGDILLNGGYMLLCAVGSMIAAMITGYFAAKVAAGLSHTLREKVFKQVIYFESEEISHFSTASLITRTTNDITQIQMIVSMGLQAIIKAPILLVWAIVKISGKQWQWSMATAGAVLVILAVLMIAVVLALPKFKIIQQLIDNINRITRENLTGIRVVRAYNAEHYQEEKFEKANKVLTDTNLFANRVMSLLMPTMTLVTSGISLVIYWIGAYLIEAADQGNRLDIFSDMVVFSSYAMQVIMSFTMLTMMFIMLPRVMVSARRVSEIIQTQPRMKNGSFTTVQRKEFAPAVEFRNVCFRYPGARNDVLSNVSFSAYPGETVAIIGATASGKSSLVNLIPRLYDVRRGCVLIDGTDVTKYNRETLRRKIGFATQKAILFSGSVESNVSYGGGVIDVESALSTAQGWDFVIRMPGGVRAAISQGGTNISGGQKQRLSIARAICRKPSIYVFDDSFSALDYKTDCALRKALAEKTKGSTKIIVAQRIGTIMDADRIVVLENGEVAGIGTHRELMEQCSIYREIAYSQLSKEELE